MAAAVHICVSCSTSSSSSSSSNHSNGNSKGGKVGGAKGVGVHSSSFGSVVGGRGNGQTTILQIYSIWALITLLAASVAIVQSAAVSFGDLLSHPTFKPLCSAQHEHYIESEGKESSLIIELKPGSYGAQHSSCSRILSAPADYGFIVRLILPKLRHHQSNGGGGSTSTSAATDSTTTNIMPATSTTKPREMLGSALSEVSTLIERLNSTVAAAAASGVTTVKGRTCPLSIFSSLDPHTPQWRVDPCQLEDTAPEMEDPVRLFHGRVRIVWEHAQQALQTKLMVTVLGKGEQCNHGKKHQCLKIGDEPLLCISKELACDGIRHCPYSNEYDSDEDYELCFKNRRPGGPQPTALESDLFEQFALEVFRNLFAYDAPSAPDEVPFKSSSSKPNSPNNESSVSSNPELMGSNVTTLHKVHTHTKDMKRPTIGDGSPNAIGPKGAASAAGPDGPKLDHNATDTATGSGFTRRNSTRNGVHSDLSKYGPWGYLMLGMLLCGGALLICGLWASASQHAVNNEREAALAAANGAGLDPTSVTSPPNYEELDPPPAYSVLFPNQKATSSTVLNTMDQASTGPGSTTTTTTTSAAAAAAESTTEPQEQQQQQQQQ